MANKINGHFRPYSLAKLPTKILEIIMPAAVKDEIHDASAVEIEPTVNGDSSEVNKKIAGLDQPLIMP